MYKYKKIETAIKHEKNKLIAYAKQKGIYENFGQKEVMKIKDHYINNSSYSEDMNNNRDLLQNFDNWCMTYNGR